MAGLISQMKGSSAMTPQGQLQQEPQPQQQPNVSPQEQAQYNQFVGNCLRVIYAPNMVKGLLSKLKGADNPVFALAQAATMVVMNVQDSADKAGAKIDPAILMQGGQEVIQAIAELSNVAKIHTYTSQEIQSAYYTAVDLFRQMRQEQGQISQKTAQSDLAQLKQAQDDGQLQKMFPNLAQYAASLNQAPQQTNQQPSQAAAQGGQ